MAKVNIKELEEKAELERKKALAGGMQEKIISGNKLFKGPFLEDWFDDYGECLFANSEAKKQAEYKKAGLDEMGRSKQQIILAKKKAELMAKKADLIKQVTAIEVEIFNLRVSKEEETSPKKGK